MKQFRIFTLLAMLSVLGVHAQEQKVFKPSGKPEFNIFSNYHSTFSDGDNFNAFQVARAYFGYGYQFSETLSGKVLLDIADPGVGKLQNTVFLKNAYLQYNQHGLTIKAGLIGLSQFKVQEKAWGHRYIYKSFQDAAKFGSSADLGLNVAYKINKTVSFDVTLMNGEGYKSVEVDSVMKVGMGVTVHPIEKLTLRAYYDNHTLGKTQMTMAFFAGYKTEKISIGGEYNMQSAHLGAEDYDYSGYSAYITWHINKKWGVFARYDNLTSKEIEMMEEDVIVKQPWNQQYDGELIIAGVEFVPVKGVKLSPNLQYVMPDMEKAEEVVSVFLNCEIKF